MDPYTLDPARPLRRGSPGLDFGGTPLDIALGMSVLTFLEDFLTVLRVDMSPGVVSSPCLQPMEGVTLPGFVENKKVVTLVSRRFDLTPL
jgi:hypothetical protein